MTCELHQHSSIVGCMDITSIVGKSRPSALILQFSTHLHIKRQLARVLDTFGDIVIPNCLTLRKQNRHMSPKLVHFEIELVFSGSFVILII